jgi:centromere protein C
MVLQEGLTSSTGSVPEPTEVLSTRRLIRSAKTVLPPPVSRSPFKTNIGSSPRRQSSVAPMSQARHTSTTPDRATSHPAVSRRLDFSEHAETSVAQSPLKTAPRRGGQRAGRSDVYDLEATPPLARHEQVIAEEDEEDGSYEVDAFVNEDYDIQYGNDDSLQLVDDYVVDTALSALQEDLEPIPPSSPTNMRKAKRKTRSSVGLADETLETEDTSNSANEQAASRSEPQKRGTKGKGKLLVTKPSQPAVEDESTILEAPSDVDRPMESSELEPVPTKKKRGRPKKVVDESEIGQEATVLIDESEVVAPKKRGRPRKDKGMTAGDEDGRPAKRPKPANKGPLTQKNSNAKMGPPKFQTTARELEGSPSKRTSPSTWAGTRAVSRLREGTPAAEAAATRSRYGRTVLRPLQHWAGERAQYDRDGTIKEVQLSESVDLPKRRAGPGQGKKKHIRRAQDLDDIEEEEDDNNEDPEEWEIRCERIAATVKEWDSAQGTIIEEAEYEQGPFLITTTSRADYSC